MADIRPAPAGRTDAASRGAAARYRLLFEHLPIPAWVHDVETLAFLEVNAAATRTYGYSREEFLALTVADLQAGANAARAPAAADGTVGAVRRHRRKDGGLIEVEITGHVVSLDGRRVELVVARDVTEERRARAAPRADEEAFRALVASAGDAIVAADTAGRITYFNAAAERLFGYQAREVEGQPITTLMPERLHDAHRGGLARYLEPGPGLAPGRTVTLVARRQDGKEFPVELSLGRWRHGDDVAFTAVLRDVTGRRQAEEALRRYAEELEAANAELDAFAYSVSHDLRAPLRSIDGFSHALVEDCGDRLGDEGREHVERVRAATGRMAHLIDDLLALSRVTRVPLERRWVDLSALAGELAAELRRTDPARRVEWVIAPGLVTEGDPRLLRLALENLLGNAWKYTRNKTRARIELGASDVRGRPTYYVRDDGAGFDMAYADKLFAPFQRLHAAGEFEGTGIGLATVARIVRRHGGRIWAEGAAGRGATFFFTV